MLKLIIIAMNKFILHFRDTLLKKNGGIQVLKFFFMHYFIPPFLFNNI